ncbi:unnamed protein product [Chilo suppressalis]|uniref:C-type lectin domain-containing protein n=1 Tax=Chilo suppressalis TaxID=168631 RepID=A0ABN8L5A4_CHISP|nr:unnamed protein product [Chilo suppressalis]
MTQLHLSSNSDSCALITGIHATISKGSFSSIEGVPLSKIRTVWAPDEPDNNQNGEDCLVMLKNGTMADVPCTETYSYVCYRKKTSEVELNECGTVDNGYKLNPKTGSCYKFHKDAVAWTHAFSVCAAEGGYLAIINSEEEAQELKLLVDSNPPETLSTTNSLSTSIGFRDWSDHTMWLTVHEDHAGLRCHLLSVATIPTRTKKFGDLFLCRTIRKWNALCPLTCSVLLTTWDPLKEAFSLECVRYKILMKLPGQTLEEAGYPRWAPDEPNNVQYDAVGGENCGSILRYIKPGAGMLNDVPCNLPLAFICEMKPGSLISPTNCGHYSEAYKEVWRLISLSRYRQWNALPANVFPPSYFKKERNICMIKAGVRRLTANAPYTATGT